MSLTVTNEKRDWLENQHIRCDISRDSNKYGCKQSKSAECTAEP